MSARSVVGAAALLLSSALSCVGYDAGVEVRVELRAPRARVGDGLNEASLNVGWVELVPCEARARRLFERVFERGRAFAHGRTSLGIDLRTQQQVELERLRPAPADYCGVRLHLGEQGTPGARVRGAGVERTMGEADVELALPEPLRLSRCAASACAGDAEVRLRFDPARWASRDSFVDAFDVQLVQAPPGRE